MRTITTVVVSLLGLFMVMAHGEGSKRGSAAVDRARLLDADAEPQSWLAGGRDWHGAYFSPLNAINTENATRLGLAWEAKLETSRGLEATPLVVDGVMYTSGNWGRVYAFDAQTGHPLWTFVPEVNGQYGRYACCDVVNRGVALWQGRVYVGALDGWLYALDAKTGSVVWKADTFVDRSQTLTITGAPQIAGDAVVIGQGGADFAQGRGFVSAYALDTGKLLWRFYTVPADPKKPAEHPEMKTASTTWSSNSLWASGGGGTPWDGMAYDPILDLLYVGTGNAAPYAWKDRSPGGGDNLYLASILAIHPKTGKLAWYYQEVPGERWDYTATQKLILADMKIGGRLRQVLMQAPKDGFFYVLDRKTGELISAAPYAAMNWANGVDLKTGRPNFTGKAEYENGPALVFPAASGAHNWHPMAFNPDTGLVYIPVIEAAMIYAKGYDLKGRSLADRWNVNGVFIEDYPAEGLPDVGLPPLAAVLKGRSYPKRRAVLRAWDPVTGRVRWEGSASPDFWEGGVLTTHGGLVFQGNTAGDLVVRNAVTGAVIKTIATGSSIMAAPMTYAIEGVQYVAVMAGYGGAPGWVYPANSAAKRYGNQGRILVFRLDGTPVTKPPLYVEPPIPTPPVQFGSAAQITEGRRLFGEQCSRCHTEAGPGLAPDLRHMSLESHAHFDDIVLRGTLVATGMGRFDDLLDATDSRDIHAYLIDEQAKAFRDASTASASPHRALPAKAN